MLRRLLLPLVLLLAPALAQAQIIAVHFADEKHVKKYKNNITYVEGEPVLVGEPGTGFKVDLAQGILDYNREGRNELFISDPGDPSRVPYKIDKDGERVAKSNKYVVGINGSQISYLTILIRDDSLGGLADEYIFRLDQLEELMDERDELEKGSKAWFLTQARVLTAYERLHSWLMSTAYPKAAERLEKDIDKERKLLEKGGARERAERAFNSIHSVPTPETLIAVSKDLTGDKIRFRVQESQHLRVVYQDSLPDTRVADVLLLGERIIEGFRNDFVDPYLSEEYADYIPDGIFHEWWFGPEDIELYEKFLVQYYGLSWGANKEKSLQMAGTNVGGVRGLTLLSYGKLRSRDDLEGRLANNLGHSLAALHYAGGEGYLPPWLAEACGYHCSLEYLGRNTVTNMEFREVKYLEVEGEEGTKTVQQSFRDYLNELARNEGPKISSLAIMTLFEMEDQDLAKSWSLYDYVGRKEGLRGQQWLRAHCQFGSAKDGMINKWREKSNAIYDVKGRDVFGLIDDRWRKFAGG